MEIHQDKKKEVVIKTVARHREITNNIEAIAQEVIDEYIVDLDNIYNDALAIHFTTGDPAAGLEEMCKTINDMLFELGMFKCWSCFGEQLKWYCNTDGMPQEEKK